VKSTINNYRFNSHFLPWCFLFEVSETPNIFGLIHVLPSSHYIRKSIIVLTCYFNVKCIKKVSQTLNKTWGLNYSTWCITQACINPRRVNDMFCVTKHISRL